MTKDFETPKTFTLIVPIKVGDVEVTEVTLREPNGNETEAVLRDEAKEGAYPAMNKLIAKQTKIAPADVRLMGARDLNILQGYLRSFLDSTSKDLES